ncbi:hypothetical protein FACS189459_3480 [Bacilli bacterium]|nr:hypothetical protein FACS189459_3480 [Bacilli bacterium]
MEKYVAIIEAGGANFSSVKNALDRLNIKYIVTSDPNKIANSYKVILPGVGNAKYSMQCIKDLKLYDVIKSLKQPTLGICLGMQLLCRSSEEGNIECLNIIPLDVCLLKDIKIIPEMG